MIYSFLLLCMLTPGQNWIYAGCWFATPWVCLTFSGLHRCICLISQPKIASSCDLGVTSSDIARLGQLAGGCMKIVKQWSGPYASLMVLQLFFSTMSVWPRCLPLFLPGEVYSRALLLVDWTFASPVMVATMKSSCSGSFPKRSIVYPKRSCLCPKWAKVYDPSVPMPSSIGSKKSCGPPVGELILKVLLKPPTLLNNVNVQTD